MYPQLTASLRTKCNHWHFSLHLLPRSLVKWFSPNLPISCQSTKSVLSSPPPCANSNPASVYSNINFPNISFFWTNFETSFLCSIQFSPFICPFFSQSSLSPLTELSMDGFLPLYKHQYYRDLSHHHISSVYICFHNIPWATNNHLQCNMSHTCKFPKLCLSVMETPNLCVRQFSQYQFQNSS